ncbi:MAG: hypothetical protein KAS32_05485 [Candidatus Peribacteraceae bacterium]|nr:hypothetical protein [Candidatus Peribacteraceae bacterium]
MTITNFHTTPDATTHSYRRRLGGVMNTYYENSDGGDTATSESEVEKSVEETEIDAENLLDDESYVNVLGTDFTDSIISQVDEALERKDELVQTAQQEVLNMDALLQNLSWEQFAALPNTQVKVADAKRLFEANEDGDTRGEIIANVELLLFNESRDFESYRSYPIITSASTSVTVIVDDAVETSVRLPIKVTGDVPRGMIISQKYTDQKLGAVSFLPIASGLKKVFGMYNIIDSESIPVYAFFYATACKSDEMIPSVSHVDIPEDFDVHRSLTETDKVLMSNTSARFKTISQQCDTLYEALRQINNYMSETIDPNYILKLMLLTQQLVYVNVAEENTEEVEIPEQEQQ